MADMTDQEFEAASERGRIEMLTKPRALSAHFDPVSRLIVVELSNDCTFAFPPRYCQGLESATDQQIAAVEVMGVGFGLGWDELDTHLTVEGLLMGSFGSQRYMERFRAMPERERLLMRNPVNQDFGQAAE